MTDTLTLPERDREHERLLGVVFNLSPAQAAIVSCLVRGTMASTEQLAAYAEVGSPVKVMVSRARARLKDHGFDIMSKMDVGYWIEPSDSKGIEEIARKFAGGK